MIKKLLLISFVFVAFHLSGQTAISGFLDYRQTNLSDGKVYLNKTSIKDLSDFGKVQNIASAAIGEKGYFEFKKNLIDEKEAVYRIYVKRFEKALNDTLQVERLFLFSKEDTMVFKKSNSPFSEYHNTNRADAEWQRLRSYESKLKNAESIKEDSLSDSYINSLKSYTKDSLQTLVVKLISIKQLDSQDLLGKDILKNKEYYLELLSELKKSDIERSQYLFLENKLAFLTTELAEQKYQRSIIVILFLIAGLFGLIFLNFRVKNKKSQSLFYPDDLSKQEKVIRSLILEGKSNKEIANELFISLSTVKSHISNIYNKLRVSDRQELIQKFQN